MKDTSELQGALKKIWSNLPPEQRKEWDQVALAGHQHLLAVRNKTLGGAKTAAPSETWLLHSLLNDDPDGLLADAVAPSAKMAIVLPGGEVLFGGVEYDQTDVDWAYVFVAWEDTKHDKPSFNTDPVVSEIPNAATFAILGDWGGNNAPAQQVGVAAKALSPPPDYFVHIGDVYYAGTDEKGILERDYQHKHFLDVWPGPSGKSFDLNSNHDMYANGTGYFKAALASPVFSAQRGCSYFALCNDSFRFVEIDSAWFDTDPGAFGYMIGNLGPTGPGTQAQFLNDQAAAAAKAGQQLILLSHHNGLSVDGKKPLPLWNQVATQLAPLKGKDVVWYWGHEHIGVVYNSQTVNGITILPRCCGHGCIPWGIATALDSPNVSWYENQLLGPGKNYFVTNGFATVAVDGSSLTEAFYGQDTNAHWNS